MDKSDQLKIRIAAPEDAPALLAIYAPYIKKTVITFEYELPTAENFKNRICSTLEQYPYLVAECEGEILGYAYASPFKIRAAYAWSAETSIYIQEDNRGKGIGKLLYQALERLCRRQHICNLCACIAWPNPASEAFHKQFGYRTVAHFHQSGYKGEQWIDMIWMEKALYPHKIPPDPFIPFSELNPLSLDEPENASN